MFVLSNPRTGTLPNQRRTWWPRRWCGGGPTASGPAGQRRSGPPHGVQSRGGRASTGGGVACACGRQYRCRHVRSAPVRASRAHQTPVTVIEMGRGRLEARVGGAGRRRQGRPRPRTRTGEARDAVPVRVAPTSIWQGGQTWVGRVVGRGRVVESICPRSSDECSRLTRINGA